MALTFPSNPVSGTTVGNYIFDGVKWKIVAVPINKLVNGSYNATLDSSGVFTAPSDVTIVGNLTVSGGTTYVNGSNTVYTDNLIELHAPPGGIGASWTSNDGKDIGFRFHYYDTSDKNAALVLAQDTGYLEWYKSGTETSGVFTGTYGVFKSAGLVITSTGNITFPDATIQTTAWTGTAAADTLSGTTLKSTVVNSSLTSVGTLTDLTVTNTITGSISGNAGSVTNGVYTSGTQTLTGKTISGNSNTLTNIANSSLTNSSITINGSAINLGGSATIKASTTNTLTIGTGLTGTSFDGGSAVTIAIGTDVATLSGTQTFTGLKTFQSGSTGVKITGTSSTTDSIIIVGRTAGTGSFTQSLTTSALSANQIATFPDATGTVVLHTASQTLTNKTISGSSNTLTNIANASLSNSAVTINGTAVSLGGSTTISSIRTFNLFGSLVPTTGTAKWFPHKSITIISGYLSIGVLSGSDVVLNIRINNTIVGTFTLPASTSRSTTQSINLAMASTDYMTADLLTTGGENLSLTLEYNT